MLTINQRAYDLYRRLGMKEEISHGGNELEITMRSMSTGDADYR